LGETKSKAAKAAKDSIPWAAVVVAILGWYDARETGQDASSKATKVADVAMAESTALSDTRARAAYDSIQETFDSYDNELDNHLQRIDDLEGWVVELEEWVEDAIEDDSPRTRAERAEREKRLASIRASKANRRLDKATKSASKAFTSPKLPDYDTVQREAKSAPLPRLDQ